MKAKKTAIEMFMMRPGHLTGYDLLPDVKPAGGSFNGVREFFRQKNQPGKFIKEKLLQ